MLGTELSTPSRHSGDLLYSSFNSFSFSFSFYIFHFFCRFSFCIIFLLIFLINTIMNWFQLCRKCLKCKRAFRFHLFMRLDFWSFFSFFHKFNGLLHSFLSFDPTLMFFFHFTYSSHSSFYTNRTHYKSSRVLFCFFFLVDSFHPFFSLPHSTFFV